MPISYIQSIVITVSGFETASDPFTYTWPWYLWSLLNTDCISLNCTFNKLLLFFLQNPPKKEVTGPWRKLGFMLSFWALDCSQHRQETKRRKPCGYHGNLSPVHRDLMLLQTEDEVSTRRQMMPQRNLWPEAPTHHQTVYLSLLCTAGLRQQVRHCSLTMPLKKKNQP